MLLNKVLLTAADYSSELLVIAMTAHALAGGSVNVAVTRDEAAVSAASAPTSLHLSALNP